MFQTAVFNRDIELTYLPDNTRFDITTSLYHLKTFASSSNIAASDLETYKLISQVLRTQTLMRFDRRQFDAQHNCCV